MICLDCRSTIINSYVESEPQKNLDDEFLSSYYNSKLDNFQFKKYTSSKKYKKDPEISDVTQTNIFNKFNLNNLKKLRLIGVGSYGKVYLVSDKTNNNQLYAVKILNKKFIEDQNLTKNIQIERKILEKFNNPFLVKLEYALQTKKRLYFFTQFMSGGDLSHHLYIENLFSQEKTKFYASELILAIEYLHNNNCIYRDLKPENITIDNEGHIKLIDFGLCKLLNEDVNDFSVCGSPEYVAPEVIFNLEYGKEIDIWSLGVVIYEMLSGCLPFEIKGNTITQDIYNQKIKMFDYFSKEAKDLIKHLLVVDPKKRYNINQIKKHKFFKGIKWEDVEKKNLMPPFIPNKDLNNLYEFFSDEKELKKIWKGNVKERDYKLYLDNLSDNESQIDSEELFSNLNVKIIDEDENYPGFSYSTATSEYY